MIRKRNDQEVSSKAALGGGGPGSRAGVAQEEPSMAAVWDHASSKLPQAFFDEEVTPAAGAEHLVALASTGPKLPWVVEPAPSLDPRDIEGADVDLSRFERSGEILGRGGMAKVERARDKRSGRAVALKLLHPHLVDNEVEVERFAREVSVLERLHHGNIIRALARSLVPPHIFFACELVDGPTAKELINACAPMPVVAASRLMVEVLQAVEQVHDRGIVHRDLKPENILIDEAGPVKLCDFGVATDIGAPPPEGLVGTLAYMSPEQARGEETGPASDLFSLGIVFYEMLIGENPFAAEEPSLTLHRLCQERSPLLFEKDATVPHAIERVVEGLLAPHLDDRFASAAKPRAILEKFLTPLAGRYDDVLMRCYREPEVTQVLVRSDQAEEELARAVAELPRNKSQACQAALALWRATRLDGSDEDATQRLHDLSTRHKFQFGTVRDAELERLVASLLEAPEDTDLLAKIIEGYRLKGDLLATVIHLKKLLRIKPGDVGARKQLVYLCGTDTDALYGTGLPPPQTQSSGT